MLSGQYADNVEILKQSCEISKLLSSLLCMLHLAKASKTNPCYKYGRTVISTKIALLTVYLNILNFSINKIIQNNLAATENMDSLFSSTLDYVAPLRLKKNSQTPWSNENTHTLKRAAWKMECILKNKKLEVFHILWKNSVSKGFKMVKSACFSSLLEEN